MGGSIPIGFAAGMLSTLSPCVLPLLPLVLGAAAGAHRFGPAALTLGMSLSFVAIGLFVATLGRSVGIDGEAVRMVSAAMLIVLGIVLLSGRLQARFAVAASGVGNLGNAWLDRFGPQGVFGQFVVGAVLGAVWSPCVGPTLGSASVLAARGEDLGAVAATMLAFGVGAALPLALIGSLSRQALLRWRGRLMGAGQSGKYVLGGGMLAIGGAIATGIDHRIETLLVGLSPAWLSDLTTRF